MEVVWDGDNSQLYIGAVVFTVGSASNISSPALSWGYILLSWSVSICLASRFPCQTPACRWEQTVIKPEGGSIAFAFLFKPICLSELTGYTVRCDLSADTSSGCLQKPVPFLQKIISPRPLSICWEEEKSCRLLPCALLLLKEMMWQHLPVKIMTCPWSRHQVEKSFWNKRVKHQK